MSEKLTPIDVQNREFARKVKGYDVDVVDAFRQEVKATLESLYRENEDLKVQLRVSKDKIVDYERLEATLRETLATAQSISDNMKRSAEKEAQAIIAQAELEAEKRLFNLQTRKAELMAQIHELKKERIKFETKLESILDLHKRMLDAFREEEARMEKVEEALTFVPKTSPTTGDE